MLFLHFADLEWRALYRGSERGRKFLHLRPYVRIDDARGDGMSF